MKAYFQCFILIAVPSEAPSLSTLLPLDPPLMLAVNRTSDGVVLQWLPPETPSSSLTGYMLQARRDQGQWVILTSNISANQSELLVKGLLRVTISFQSVCFKSAYSQTRAMAGRKGYGHCLFFFVFFFFFCLHFQHLFDPLNMLRISPIFA